MQATCRNCGKVPEPGSPLGLCSPCLMARLMDLAPAPVSEPRDADDYEVLRQLAKGGMGTVMEARDLTLRRTVAMKVMDRTTPGQAHDRFDREARVLARLEHPNIVPIHAMGRDPEGRPFYTMKLVRGETLQAILNQLRKGSLRTVKRYPLAELLGIFQKVGQAVAFAHSRGVIHRDLKPENIMVGEFGEVLVMDWGLAKVAGESETSGGEAEEGIRETSNRSLQDLAVGLTLDGAVMGTPQFMSPEQASGRITELDTRSDIFSLGAILYAILTLRPPVRGGSVEEVLAKVRSGEIVPPTLYNHAAERPTEQVISLDETTVRLQKTRDLPHCPHGRVPEALSAVTMRAMALQTGERYQTVTELLAEIESYLGGFATSVENVGALGQLWLLMKRHQVVSALLGVMLVLSAGFMAKVIASEGKARRSAELATKEALNARQAETRAVNEATNARLAEASARRSLAESRIALADAALRDRDAAQMRRHLTSVSEDHRNEDWHYLNRSLRPALGSIPAGEAKLFHDVKAVPGPAGELIASSRTGDVLVIQATTRSITRRIRTGLTGPLRVAMSADASLVAVARDGGDGYRVFDYRTGTLRHQLPTAGGEVFSLSFAGPGAEELFVVERQPNQGRKLRLADGKTLWSTPMGLETAVAPAGQFIAAHYSNAAQDVRLIDAKDGSTLRKMDAEGERSFIWQLDFSPDGKLLAAGDHLGDVHLWEVATGRLVQRFNAGVGRLQGMAFGPADTLMTLCEEAREDSISPRSLRIWNYRSMAEMASFIGLDFEESRFAYSQQANVVMTRGPRLNFYPVPVGKEQHIIPARSDGRHVSFLGETNLVAGTASSFFGLYALAEALPPRQVWTAPDDTFAMGVSGDGRRALLASRAPRYLQGYQLTLDPSGRLDSVVTNLLPHAVWAAGLSHNGQIALLAGKRGDVQFYDVAQNQLRGVLHPAGGALVKQLRFCADDQRAVTLSQGTREAGQATDILTLWDLGRRHAIVEVTNQFVCHRFALNPDQQRLALVGTDLQVRIYDTATLTLVRQFRAHNKSINDVAFHPTKPVLATASDDMSVKLWDLHTGEMIEHFIGPARPPLSLAFSPSGQLLAAGCADKTTRVWLVRALSPVDTAAE